MLKLSKYCQVRKLQHTNYFINCLCQIMVDLLCQSVYKVLGSYCKTQVIPLPLLLILLLKLIGRESVMHGDL